MRNLLYLSLLILCVGCGQTVSRAEKWALASSRSEDLTLDRSAISPEGWMGKRYSKDGLIFAEEFDSLHDDGRIDMWRLFSGGVLLVEEVDETKNGDIDVRRNYKNGAIFIEARDTTGSGVMDRFLRYQNGAPVEVGSDVNFDGSPDEWVSVSSARRRGATIEERRVLDSYKASSYDRSVRSRIHTTGVASGQKPYYMKTPRKHRAYGGELKWRKGDRNGRVATPKREEYVPPKREVKPKPVVKKEGRSFFQKLFGTGKKKEYRTRVERRDVAPERIDAKRVRAETPERIVIKKKAPAPERTPAPEKAVWRDSMTGKEDPNDMSLEDYRSRYNVAGESKEETKVKKKKKRRKFFFFGHPSDELED